MEKNSSLKSFLIKRFLLILGCTAIAEALINRVYYDYVFPQLRIAIGSEDLFVSKGFWGVLTDIVLTIIRMAFYAITERLMGGFSIFARKYVTPYNSMGIINTGKVDSGLFGRLYPFVMFVIIVALLVIILLIHGFIFILGDIKLVS